MTSRFSRPARLSRVWRFCFGRGILAFNPPVRWRATVLGRDAATERLLKRVQTFPIAFVLLSGRLTESPA